MYISFCCISWRIYVKRIGMVALLQCIMLTTAFCETVIGILTGHCDFSTCCCAWEAFERHSFIFSHITDSALPRLVDLWQTTFLIYDLSIFCVLAVSWLLCFFVTWLSCFYFPCTSCGWVSISAFFLYIYTGFFFFFSIQFNPLLLPWGWCRNSAILVQFGNHQLG